MTKPMDQWTSADVYTLLAEHPDDVPAASKPAFPPLRPQDDDGLEDVVGVLGYGLAALVVVALVVLGIVARNWS